MSTEPTLRCEFEAKKLLLSLKVEVPAEPGAITPVVQSVLRIASQMKCAEGKEFEIETALREALANAIRHGCAGNPHRAVECTVMCDEARGMLIVVKDPGPGFDPQTVASPLRGENLFLHHGRGIYLINQLMDEVRFENGGTEIHMRKG